MPVPVWILPVLLGVSGILCFVFAWRVEKTKRLLTPPTFTHNFVFSEEFQYDIEKYIDRWLSIGGMNEVILYQFHLILWQRRCTEWARRGLLRGVRKRRYRRAVRNRDIYRFRIMYKLPVRRCRFVRVGRHKETKVEVAMVEYRYMYLYERYERVRHKKFTGDTHH